MNTAYIAGIVCGVLASFLVCWIIFSIRKKQGRTSKEYDERQQALRDKGFRVAYFTLVGYMAVFALLHSLDVIGGEAGGWLFIGVIISLLVHIIYSIYNDAYFKASDSPQTFPLFFTIIGVSNTVLGVLKRVNGEVEGGFPSYGDLNLIIGVMLLIVALNIFVKMQLDKRAEEN